MTAVEEQAPLPGDEHAPDDQETPPAFPVASLERVNAMMGRWYRLQADVDSYDQLHKSELARLKRRREEAVGPTERRIARIRSMIEQFSVQSFLAFGKQAHRVPNGDITSRPVKPTIEKNDEAASKWMTEFDELDDAVEMRPWVDMAKLRKWLDARVAAGDLQRMVSRPPKPGTDDEVVFYLVDEEQGWTDEFDPGFVGVWFWTEQGIANYGGANEGDVLAGVTWKPNGTIGCGRNFQVKL